METLIGDESAHKATAIKVVFRSHFGQGDILVFTSGTSSTAIASKTTQNTMQTTSHKEKQRGHSAGLG